MRRRGHRLARRASSVRTPPPGPSDRRDRCRLEHSVPGLAGDQDEAGRRGEQERTVPDLAWALTNRSSVSETPLWSKASALWNGFQPSRKSMPALNYARRPLLSQVASSCSPAIGMCGVRAK